jgi:hypothetical protein
MARICAGPDSADMPLVQICNLDQHKRSKQSKARQDAGLLLFVKRGSSNKEGNGNIKPVLPVKEEREYGSNTPLARICNPCHIYL